MLPSRLFVSLTVGLALAAAGCDRGAALYPVSGSVTLDGAPLPEGDILLVPADTSIGPEGGQIKDGKYNLKAREGKVQVQISASKIKPGGAKGAGGEPVAEEYIPAKYNVESTLSAEIKSSGENKFDFALESK
jgi:hypothetical protein